MRAHFPSVVTSVGDQLIVDAEVLVPKLGPSVEALKENMRKGLARALRIGISDQRDIVVVWREARLR